MSKLLVMSLVNPNGSLKSIVCNNLILTLNSNISISDS